MPRIPVQPKEQEEWIDDDLEHDHLGRPVRDRRPRRPVEQRGTRQGGTEQRRPPRNDED